MDKDHGVSVDEAATTYERRARHARRVTAVVVALGVLATVIVVALGIAGLDQTR